MTPDASARGADDHRALSIAACVLTTGDRPDSLADAVGSLRAAGITEVAVLANGCALDDPPPGSTVHESSDNLGVPGGRQRLAELTDADLLLFLDDDAVVRGDWLQAAIDRFADDPTLAAMSLRIVDERGETARRHVPRVGNSGVDSSGPVATFLGGASILRRDAMDEVGGYWSELFYSHEELDLSWRLYDRGYHVYYEAAGLVYHPRTEIGRHQVGWELSGRNRVMVARRNLPWPIAGVHVATWLVAGLWRAPDWGARRAYARGWWRGWREPVERRPLRWATLATLGRAGRFPIV